MATSGDLKIGHITFESSAKDAKRIKDLEALLAKEAERVSELAQENKKLEKENFKLEAELKQTRYQRDTWRRYYEKLKGEKNIPCDREAAMVVHGEVRFGEIAGG